MTFAPETIVGATRRVRFRRLAGQVTAAGMATAIWGEKSKRRWSFIPLSNLNGPGVISHFALSKYFSDFYSAASGPSAVGPFSAVNASSRALGSYKARAVTDAVLNSTEVLKNGGFPIFEAGLPRQLWQKASM